MAFFYKSVEVYTSVSAYTIAVYSVAKNYHIRQRQLNFLLYGQSGELYRVSWSVRQQNNNNQGIIQKRSAPGSRMLPFVIFDKKVHIF